VTMLSISTPRQYIDRGWPAVSANITIEGRRFDIFYRASQGPLSTNAEVFLAVALVPAMRAGASVYVAAPLSPLVLARMERLQELLSAWFSHLHRVKVEAEPLAGAPAPMAWPGRRGAACFFSGGVDSFYSALTLRDQLTHLVFVHGLDIPLSDQAFRQSVSMTLHEAATAIGKPLIDVETNLRDLLDHYADWVKEGFNPALASVALLLAPQLHTVYSAAGGTHLQLPTAGAHPLVNALLSTHDVEFAQSGGAATRYEKVAYLAQSDVALRYLRVCWERPGGAYNCGRCSKCLHTMIDLHLAGALARCHTFDRSLDLDLIRHALLRGGSERGYFAEALQVAERQGDKPELVQALREQLGDAAAMSSEEIRPSLDRAETRVTNLELALQREKKRSDRLRRQMNMATASRSWRLTAPLRRAGRMWRAMRERLRWRQ
jgi:hypothetical protein